MAELHELIERVADEKLREELREAADKLLKQKKFGLVFEDHQPEYTPLYEIPVKKGSRVSRKYGDAGVCWKVLKIKDGAAVCQPEKGTAGRTWIFRWTSWCPRQGLASRFIPISAR